MNTRKIKKRIWIYTALLCVSLSGFVFSCYGPEIDELDNRMREVEKTLADLKQKVEDKKFITSVIPITGGFRITFDDNSSYDITNGAPGAKGLDATTWNIGADSMWWYSTNSGGSVGTKFPAIPKDGKNGQDGKDGQDGLDGLPGRDGADGQNSPSPKISPDGFWILWEWSDASGGYAEVRTSIPASMTPYIVDVNPGYVDLFVPEVDSLNYYPPQIVYNSVRLPRYYEEPLVLYFSGYGYLPSSASTTIQVLDSLSFNYWQITSATPATWEGAKRFPNDTLVTLGLPPAAGQLLLLYSSNKPITIDPSAPLRLQDSKDTSNVFFEIDDTAPTKVTQLLTKAVYSYDTYYSSLKIRSSLASTIVLPTTEKILYYLAHDTVKSIASHPIRAISPAISVPLNTLNTTGIVVDTTFTGNTYRGFKNVPKGSPVSLKLSNTEFLYDSYISDTATASPPWLTISGDKQTFSIPAAAEDTSIYLLVLNKLLLDGNIKTDTILISTRDTIHDITKYPVP